MCFCLKGPPGSAGLKGESGDPGPQVSKDQIIPAMLKVSFIKFILAPECCWTLNGSDVSP